jgi:hypothetical protein
LWVRKYEIFWSLYHGRGVGEESLDDIVSVSGPLMQEAIA